MCRLKLYNIYNKRMKSDEEILQAMIRNLEETKQKQKRDEKQ